MDLIPNEILYQVCNYLDPSELAMCKGVSRKTRNVVSDVIRRRTKKLIQNNLFKKERKKLSWLNDRNYFIYNTLRSAIDYGEIEGYTYCNITLLYINDRFINVMKLNENLEEEVKDILILQVPRNNSSSDFNSKIYPEETVN